MKLVKLHVEQECGKFEALLIFNELLSRISKFYTFKTKTGISYPVKITEISSMFSLGEIDGTYHIGILPSRLSDKKYDLYKKILDVEYGVNGKETRILRKVFEDYVIYFNEVSKSVSHSL